MSYHDPPADDSRLLPSRRSSLSDVYATTVAWRDKVDGSKGRVRPNIVGGRHPSFRSAGHNMLGNTIALNHLHFHIGCSLDQTFIAFVCCEIVVMDLPSDGGEKDGRHSARLLQDAIYLSLKNIRSIEIPDPNDPETSDIVSAEQTLNRIIATLVRSGHEREASAIDTAIDHCLTRKKFGGLGLSLEGRPSEVLQNAISFQVEVWLEALNSEDRARKLPKALSERPKDRRPMTLSEKIFAHHSINSLETAGMAVGDIMRVSVDWVVASELAWAVLNTVSS